MFHTFNNGETMKNTTEYNRLWLEANPEKTEAYTKRWRKENMDKVNTTQRKYYNEHKDKIYKYRKKWRLDHPELIKAYQKKGQERHKEKRAVYAKARYIKKSEEIKINNKKIRNECLSEYSFGNLICSCCGEKQIDFLTLDHINNDGYADKNVGRKKRRGGVGLYTYLKKRGFPSKERYQVLCYNCNCAKGKNGGVCPHKTKVIL